MLMSSASSRSLNGSSFCPQNKPQGELYVLTLTAPPSRSLAYFLVFCNLCFTVRKSSFMLLRSIFFCTPFVVGETVIFLAPLKKKKGNQPNKTTVQD